MVLSILGIILLWRLIPGSPATLALVGVAALFLFGLKRPIWAVAALLVSQLTVTSYMISTPFGWISLRLLLLLATLLIMIPTFARRGVDLGPRARKVIVPVLILIFISAIANLVNSGFDFAFKDFRNMMVGLLIVILLPAATRNLKELKILCGVAFVVIAASAVIGLMQHYGFLGMDQATLIPNFLSGDWEGAPRVPGMGETELELAYILSATLLVVLAMYLAKGVNSSTKKLLVIAMLLMAPALYFTYTRSALLALVLGLATLPLFVKTRIRGEVILSAALAVILLIELTGAFEGMHLGGRAEEVQEESTISRKILWQAGIDIALDNPVLGIGGDRFGVVSTEYASSVDPSLLEWEEERYWGYRTLGSGAIHNDFLHVWVSYGTVALVVYAWLFMVTMRNFVEAYRKSQRGFIKGLALGLACALVAYVVNAFYHNLMRTLPLLWVLAGFSLVLTKLTAQRQAPAEKAVSQE